MKCNDFANNFLIFSIYCYLIFHFFLNNIKLKKLNNILIIISFKSNLTTINIYKFLFFSNFALI